MPTDTPTNFDLGSSVDPVSAGPKHGQDLPNMPDPSQTPPERGPHLPTMPDPTDDPERGQHFPAEPDPTNESPRINDPLPEDSDGEVEQVA
jgi:hypothetical protein